MYYILIDGYPNDLPKERWHFSVETFHNAYEPEICESFKIQLKHIAGIFDSWKEAIAKRDEFCENKAVII